jgi:hypothetical protein
VLNTTAASATVSNSWLNTDATNLGYLVGTTAVASQTHVAYCWAEIPGFSKFGSYLGNGSSDGLFVYCGFRPRWIMVKLSSNSGESWLILDTLRNTYNPETQRIYADQNIVEDSSGQVDILSNGFKWRQGSVVTGNQSGLTYIFAAFAEFPLSDALAR